MIRIQMADSTHSESRRSPYRDRIRHSWKVDEAQTESRSGPDGQRAAQTEGSRPRRRTGGLDGERATRIRGAQPRGRRTTLNISPITAHFTQRPKPPTMIMGT